MYNSTNALLKGIQTKFAMMLEGEKDFTWAPMSETITSRSNQEDYLVYNALPGITEWLDKINYGSITDFKQTVINKSWATGFPVDRDVVNDSKGVVGGNVELSLKTAVRKWNSFPNKKLNELLTANGTAFDSTAFFANSRPNIDTGSNTIDNLYAGTSGGPYTFAQFEADYAGAKAALLGFRDSDGDPMNEGASLVVLVPQHLSDLANKLLSDRADRVYDGTAEKSNIYRGTAEIVVNDYQLPTSDDWYILNVNAAIKPFLVQDRTTPTWDKEERKDEKMVKYFTDARIGFSLLNPFAAIKIDN